MLAINNELVKFIKPYSRQIIAAITGILFAVSDGMSYGWTSLMIPKSHIRTKKVEADWLETTLYCGSLAGLPLTIYSVDKFGRKKSILFASVSMLLGWILIAVGNRMVYLFVGRFICGIGSDIAFIASPMYLAEISDQRIRGFLSGMVYDMIHIGFILAVPV